MTGKRRLAVIQDVENKESKELRNFKLKIRKMQDTLQSKILTSDANDKATEIITVLNKNIAQKIYLNGSQTFETIESVKENFDQLLAILKDTCKSFIETHKPLYKGLCLLIDWYRIIAIEAYLHAPLAKEINEDEMHKENSNKRESLIKKAEMLCNDVTIFNQELTNLERQNAEYEVKSLQLKEDDSLIDYFYPLLSEEEKLTKFASSRDMIELKGKRDQLEQCLSEVHDEINDFILQFKKLNHKQSQNRTDILGIDVYYLAEFRKKNQEQFYSYKKLMDKHQQVSIDKSAVIMKHIQELTNQLDIFDKEILEFSKSTYMIAGTSYRTAINELYALLTTERKLLKENSPVLVLKKEYISRLEYVQFDLPKLERDIEEQFITLGRTFLANVDKNKMTFLKEEAKTTQEKEMKVYEKPLQIPVEVKDINSIRLINQRAEKINDAWREGFNILLKNEISSIKNQFEVLKQFPSSSSLNKITQLRSDFHNKKEELEKILLSVKAVGGRAETIASILNTAHKEWDDNILFVDIHHYINKVPKKWISIEMVPTQSALPIEKENENKELKDSKRPTPVLNRPISQESSRTYKKFIDKPWKRAIFIGFMVAVAMGLVFSLWIGMTGLSLLAIVSGSFFAGSMCYLSWNFCCTGTNVTNPSPPSEPINKRVDVRIRAGSFQDALRGMEKKNDISDPVLAKEKRGGAFFDQELNRSPLSNESTSFKKSLRV